MKSIHSSVNEMHERVRKDGLSSVLDRFDEQNGRCRFCE